MILFISVTNYNQYECKSVIKYACIFLLFINRSIKLCYYIMYQSVLYN